MHYNVWYKKWWIWVVVIFLFCVIITIPVLIDYAYMTGTTDGKANTVFSASDLLAFYGGFLAFLGTVGLGFLALWQNKRLETLNREANNQNIVNKIIEIESKRLEYLEAALDAFTDACDPQKIWEIKYEMTPNNDLIISKNDCLDKAALLVQQKRLIVNEFYKVTRAFKKDTELIIQPDSLLMVSFSSVYFGACNLLELLENEVKESCIGKYSEQMQSLTNTCKISFAEFLAEKEKYLAIQNQKLDQLLYSSISLSEIKAIYTKRGDI